MVQQRSRSHKPSSRRDRRTGTRGAVIRVVVGAIALAIALAALYSYKAQRATASVTDLDTLDTDVAGGQIAPIQQQLSRRIYPYSVVAGGVYSVDELRTAMVDDPTVADHYRDLRPAAMHAEVVNSPHQAYMSYRKADRVYWTKRKLPLHQGETILTDGREAVRARCGNRLSDVPRSPTSADEPATVAFEVETGPAAPVPVVPSRPITAFAGSGIASPVSGGAGLAQPLALGGGALFGPSGYGSAAGSQTAFAPFGLAFPVGTFEHRPGGHSGSFPPGTAPGGTIDPGPDPSHNAPPFIPQVPGGLSQDPPGGPGGGGGPGGPGVGAPLVHDDTQPPSDRRSVPEPGSLALWGVGMLWAATRLYRRGRHQGGSR